jgi:hypothetical protein
MNVHKSPLFSTFIRAAFVSLNNLVSKVWDEKKGALPLCSSISREVTVIFQTQFLVQVAAVLKRRVRSEEAEALLFQGMTSNVWDIKLFENGNALWFPGSGNNDWGLSSASQPASQLGDDLIHYFRSVDTHTSSELDLVPSENRAYFQMLPRKIGLI